MADPRVHAQWLKKRVGNETIDMWKARRRYERAQKLPNVWRLSPSKEAARQERSKSLRRRHHSLYTFNKWRKYRAEGVPNNILDTVSTEERDHYYAGLYPNYMPDQYPYLPDFPLFDPTYDAVPQASRAALDSATLQAQDDFLARDVKGLGPLWMGKKAFGAGGQALVGLWENLNPRGAPLFPPHVVVKEKFGHASQDLSAEARIMGNLRDVGSAHIVKLLSKQFNTRWIEDPETREFYEEISAMNRIIMEFCSQGSLEDLLERRQESELPFDERSLWRIFECLAKGLSVLERGYELTMDMVNQPGGPEKYEWKQVYHSDLKMDNVLLGPRDGAHQWTPVCKLADFGLALDYGQDMYNDLPTHLRELQRGSGTRGWYPSEHFTEAWDYKDEWKDSPVAGRFSPLSDTWTVGAIMYALLMFQRPPLPSSAFYPRWQLNGHWARGLTYGVDMQANARYSHELRNVIWECLYEIPLNRPTTVELKRSIAAGLEAAMTFEAVAGAEDDGEPWVNFDPDDAVDPFDPVPDNVLLPGVNNNARGNNAADDVAGRSGAGVDNAPGRQQAQDQQPPVQQPQNQNQNQNQNHNQNQQPRNQQPQNQQDQTPPPGFVGYYKGQWYGPRDHPLRFAPSHMNGPQGPASQVPPINPHGPGAYGPPPNDPRRLRNVRNWQEATVLPADYIFSRSKPAGSRASAGLNDTAAGPNNVDTPRNVAGLYIIPGRRQDQSSRVQIQAPPADFIGYYRKIWYGPEDHPSRYEVRHVFGPQGPAQMGIRPHAANYPPATLLQAGHIFSPPTPPMDTQPQPPIRPANPAPQVMQYIGHNPGALRRILMPVNMAPGENVISGAAEGNNSARLSSSTNEFEAFKDAFNRKHGLGKYEIETNNAAGGNYGVGSTRRNQQRMPLTGNTLMAGGDPRALESLARRLSGLDQ